MPNDAKMHLLVVVHPGSACGSADFNLGMDLARACRDSLIADIKAWRGGAIVITGGLCDEIKRPAYAALDVAISNCLRRARYGRLVSKKVRGPSADLHYCQTHAIHDVIRKLRLSPASVCFELTGAWYDSGIRGCGCVNSVHDKVVNLGFEAAPR